MKLSEASTHLSSVPSASLSCLKYKGDKPVPHKKVKVIATRHFNLTIYNPTSEALLIFPVVNNLSTSDSEREVRRSLCELKSYM
jgi:hypothetical protein